MLAASMWFYASSALWYLAPLLVTALLDFVIGQRVDASQREAYRRRLITISVVANLGLLSVFKYTTWLSSQTTAFAAMFGLALTPFVVPLPAAISFYTFQSMSYTIDIYRKEFKPYRSVVDYLSFVSFFPHLVAGPMMRARDLLPQLASIRPIPQLSVIASALYLILFGLFVKVVLADNLGGIVEKVENAVVSGDSAFTLAPGLGLVFGYAFTFQIYCDFSAYSSIARGVARLFGVELMRNFLTPYVSSNPSEFWQRWHISLSSWLRDYLYIPLGGNRGSFAATMRNLLLTMFLGGLWHGAGILFIVWGLYHGLLLIIYRIIPIDVVLVRYLGKLGRFLAIFMFFHLVVIGWIFFRAQPEHVGAIFQSITALPSAVSAHIMAYMPYFNNLPPIESVGSFKALSHFLITANGTVIGFLTSNWTLLVYGWGTVLFAIPAIATDYIAFRKNLEFGDLLPSMSIPIAVLSIVALFYGIVLFGRRHAVDFIYFAF